MFRKPVQGKRAKTISCKNAHPDEKVAKAVYKRPDIRGVSPVEILEKTSYAEVKVASVEGALVKKTLTGSVNEDITLNGLFESMK